MAITSDDLRNMNQRIKKKHRKVSWADHHGKNISKVMEYIPDQCRFFKVFWVHKHMVKLYYSYNETLRFKEYNKENSLLITELKLDEKIIHESKLLIDYLIQWNQLCIEEPYLCYELLNYEDPFN